MNEAKENLFVMMIIVEVILLIIVVMHYGMKLVESVFGWKKMKVVHSRYLKYPFRDY